VSDNDRRASNEPLTPWYGGRPVGNLMKFAKPWAITEPPPNATLFLGLLFCQSYQILSTICEKSCEMNGIWGKTSGGNTNSVVQEERGIVRGPFRSGRTVNSLSGTITGHVAAEVR